MAMPDAFSGRLMLPAIASPMFLVSGPELVIETCKAGMVGTFPALNQRTSEGFEEWLITIKTTLAEFEETTGETAAPFGVNLIVHGSNPRLEADLALCAKHEVPLVITSLGAASKVVDAVHSYGGLVFHDVITKRHAQKAADAGVDGIIAVATGAGGHAGTVNPFALISEIRSVFDGTLVLAGCLNTGRDIAAAQVMGADMAYMGTRFINTQESCAVDEYKTMIAESEASDIVYTKEISGIYGNFLKPSLSQAGRDPDTGKTQSDVQAADKTIDLGEELTAPKDGASAWKSIWSAGQGVGGITDAPSAAQLIAQLHDEYVGATIEFGGLSREYALKPQRRVE
jgi:nitronate monooxygenase